MSAELAGNNQPQYQIYQGDALAVLKTLPDESVHCCITSPPYWGLRDYGIDGQLGLEESPEEYIAKMLEIFREVRRVLRTDGTLWLNLGDSYIGGNRGGSQGPSKQQTNRGSRRGQWFIPDGLKVKDLCGMPWRVAFALQADGWYLRADIIWHKPSAMPESINDRPTRCHEYIFLLTKSDKYFYDAEAIKEPVTGNAKPRGNGVNPKAKMPGINSRIFVDRKPHRPNIRKTRQNESFSAAVSGLVLKRNKRTIWTVASSPLKEAHFATFPPKLIEPCILAGTSEVGCCSSCGASYKRILEPSPEYAKHLGKSLHDHSADKERGMMQAKRKDFQAVCADYITAGWQPGCNCREAAPLFAAASNLDQPIPCTVLDPFAGAGTTLLVATLHGRRAIGIELNPDYIAIAEKRITAG